MFGNKPQQAEKSEPYYAATELKGEHTITSTEHLTGDQIVDYFRNILATEYPELTWSRWYFPVINCANGLQTLDHYLQQSVRVLATGKHSKANYRTTYNLMKRLGYRSLVHEYYDKREINWS